VVNWAAESDRTTPASQVSASGTAGGQSLVTVWLVAGQWLVDGCLACPPSWRRSVKVSTWYSIWGRRSLRRRHRRSLSLSLSMSVSIYVYISTYISISWVSSSGPVHTKSLCTAELSPSLVTRSTLRSVNDVWSFNQFTAVTAPLRYWVIIIHHNTRLVHWRLLTVTFGRHIHPCRGSGVDCAQLPIHWM